MPNIGAPGYILLMILALLLFGPNKLPELGRAVGVHYVNLKTRQAIFCPKTNGRNVKASKIVYFKHPGRRLQKFSLNLRKNGCRKTINMSLFFREGLYFLRLPQYSVPS